jgi:hypothetical protein
MDSERTARRTDRPTGARSWRSTPGGEFGGAGDGAESSPTGGAGPREPDGDVVTDLLDPEPATRRGNGETSTFIGDPTTGRPSLPAKGSRRHVLPTAPADDETVRPNQRRWRVRVAYAMVIVALGVGVAIGVSSRAQLHRTDAEVASTQARLRHTLDQARRAEATLTAVSAQATSAASILATETAQLASVQSQLASAEADVFTNGVSINDLDLCLSGVERALNQISLADQAGAAATLDGVAASCRGAAPSP